MGEVFVMDFVFDLQRFALEFRLDIDQRLDKEGIACFRDHSLGGEC